MHPRILVLIPLLILVGCASPQPRMSAEEWFDQEAQRWVDAVSQSCEATHQNYITGKSPVDCGSLPPQKLRMSFPNKPFFVRHELGIGEYLHAWCVAVMNRHGNNPAVEIVLREERRRHGLPCNRILQKVRRHRQE